MRLQVFDRCIHLDDNWDNLRAYYVNRITENEILIGTELISEKNSRVVSLNEFDKLQIFPFSF